MACFRNIPAKAVVGAEGSFQAEGWSSSLEAPDLQRCSWSLQLWAQEDLWKLQELVHKRCYCALPIAPPSSSPRWAQPGSTGIWSSPKSRSTSLCSTEGNEAELF